MNLDLSGYGIEAKLEEGDMILDVIVLMRVLSKDDPMSALVVATTPGLDWIMQTGMIETAREIMRDSPLGDRDDE